LYFFRAAATTTAWLNLPTTTSYHLKASNVWQKDTKCRFACLTPSARREKMLHSSAKTSRAERRKEFPWVAPISTSAYCKSFCCFFICIATIYVFSEAIAKKRFTNALFSLRATLVLYRPTDDCLRGLQVSSILVTTFSNLPVAKHSDLRLKTHLCAVVHMHNIFFLLRKEVLHFLFCKHHASSYFQPTSKV